MSRRTPPDAPGVAVLLDAVGRRAAEAPEAIAVVAHDGTFTFAELEAAVARIAGALRAAAGAAPVAGLCLGRSRWLVPALLAVWRAGGVAVPTDPHHPATRIAHALADTGVRVVLGHPGPAVLLPERTTCLDPATLAADGAPDSAAPAVAPDDVAYVIHTSGTTGAPKGVEITYRGLGTFLEALAGLRLAPGGVGINAVSTAFDGWLWCTLLGLVCGQGVALLDAAAQDADALPDRIADLHPVTVCLTPSLMAAVVDRPDRLEGVQTVVVAGEACPPALADRLPAGARVLNVYGPTETTIAATWADGAAGDDIRGIGRALPGYTTHVLGPRRHPVPAGTPGELYIGGPAVARGYRGRPGLTAARFVPDPFADGPAARMYRTGDLVVERADGQLQFLGRIDNQVKVRGVRIELGEVERAVATVEGVLAAVALPLGDGQILGVAVRCVGGADPAALLAAARQECGRRLPAAAVPGRLLVVDDFPTTPAGKVDRIALALRFAAPEPGPSATGGDPAARPPGTETERLVCTVWSELLGEPVVDVEASFFDIGGHSLLAARTVSALRRRTGLRIVMGDVLSTPTAAALAARIDALAAAAPAPAREEVAAR